MSTARELMASGLAAAVARQLGQTRETGISAAGSTQGTATQLKAGANYISTAAASSGVILPAASDAPISAVYNGGANAVTVYPATGETINGLSANSGFSVTNGKSATFIPSVNSWIATLSA